MAFARQLEVNNQDTILHPDPTYICDVHPSNLQAIVLENETMVKMFDMRYYRDTPNGVDKLLSAKNVNMKEIIGRKLYFRSPMTCASAARGLGICYRCYGDLAYVNRDINVGQIAAEGLSSIYTQILLSAKHLLESLVVKMEWSDRFYDFFQVNFNSIALKEDTVYRGFSLIINEDIQVEEELDDIDFNYYVTSFAVKAPTGEIFVIKTSNSDNLYFEKSFYKYLIETCPDKTKASDETYYAELDMVELMNFPVLFMVDIKNNELSATMNKIQKLIDNKSVINSYDKNSILREFIVTNIQGNIKLNAVHFEVLLMNQIRDADEELDTPDWTIPNARYQILTLSRSLSNNRSITVRLESNKTSKALNSPQNDNLYKPAMSDVFFMESPQEYLKPELISDEDKPKSDILHAEVEEPITFSNPKIRVGRARKKNVSQTGE